MTAVSRLGIINDALLLTGMNTFTEPDDGTPDWNCCSAAYDKGLRRILDKHDWKFSKVVENVDERDDPDDPAWQDAYAKPDGCIHVIRVLDQDGGALTEWKILGNNILVNKDDGIAVEFIREGDPEDWPNLFADAMMHFLFAGIYRGILKDASAARKEEAQAEAVIMEARPRGDSEDPPQARFVSSLATARSRRRG